MTGTTVSSATRSNNPRMDNMVSILPEALFFKLVTSRPDYPCGFPDVNCARELALDLYAAPEGDVIADLLGGVRGLRVIPGGVAVSVAVHHHVVITRDPFPSTARVGIARAQKFLA